MKNKGFTLAELLAVLVVLGIIATIIVPSVTRQVNKTREKLCVVQYENILNSARAYGTEHITELGSGKTITLNELINGGYISGEKLKDPIEKQDISTDLQIKIVKSGKKYQYSIIDNGHIGCKSKLKNISSS